MRIKSYALLMLCLILCLPTLIPILSALLAWFQIDRDTADHLIDYVLPSAMGNSLRLMILVGAISTLVGTSLAALIAITDFPLRRFFSWALLLPLALPGYVSAVAFIGLFDGNGSLPEVRNFSGLVFVLSASLYPYVYLLAREAFAAQGLKNIEVLRTLGYTPISAFFYGLMPLARPWIAAGGLLVMMETLADFGTVSAFNIDTLTTAIYKAWFSLFSVQSALQISSVLLLIVAVLVVLEKIQRKRQRFFAQHSVQAKRYYLQGAQRWCAFGGCALVLILAFAMPLCRLLWQSVSNIDMLDIRWWQFTYHSLMLSALAALVCAVAGMCFALLGAGRNKRPVFSRSIEFIGTAGYGLPGALLAVGLFVPVTAFSVWLSKLLGWPAWIPGLSLLLAAYLARFCAVSHAPIAAGLSSIKPSWVESSQLLGVNGWQRILQLYAPLLRRSVWLALLMVFVDVMKEVPITLMMRPFGWDTLSTRVFELSNEGLWAQAALPAVVIVLAGLIPVIILNRGAGNEA
jgi:iron(III) transport system permease protein